VRLLEDGTFSICRALLRMIKGSGRLYQGRRTAGAGSEMVYCEEIRLNAD